MLYKDLILVNVYILIVIMFVDYEIVLEVMLDQ